MKTACVNVPSHRHTFPGHPESPDRFSLFEQLKTLNLPGEWTWLEALPATEAEVLRVHSPQVLEVIREGEKHPPVIIDEAPTYISAGSFEAARLAAGGALAVTRAVLGGEAQAGLALVRPPGHHAEKDRSMGFCLFNNLAIAVQDALDHAISRALIMDFDAHHGNGTQDIFQDEERAAYVSTHQYGIYPGTGGLTPLPNAKGRVVNIPLPVYAGDKALLDAITQVVYPLGDRLRPEMVFVSAGFDAHWKDPLTMLGASTKGFYEISKALIALADELCGGKIVFILEGGYNQLYLKENVQGIMAALAGVPLMADSAGLCPYPEEDIQPILNRVRQLHGL